MTREEWLALNTYKAERRRGIVHTPEWETNMFRLHGEWELEMRSKPLGPHSWDRRPGFWMRIIGRKLSPTPISDDLRQAIKFLHTNAGLTCKDERTLLRKVENRIHGGLPVGAEHDKSLTLLAQRIRSEMLKDPVAR